MFGIALALAAGILLSLADTGKKILTQNLSAELIILLMFTFGLLVNIGFLTIQGLPPIAWRFVWLPALLCGLLAAIGELVFLYGLRDTDLSIGMPLFAFLPVFSCIIGYLLFGEIPRPLGGVGAAAIISGAYLLLVRLPIRHNLFAPLQRLRSDRACLLMILAAFIGAVLFVGQRYGVRHSSPVTFFTMMLAIDWVIFAGMTLYRGSGVSRAQTTPHLLSIVVLTGMAWGVGLTCLYASYNYTLALYAGSVMQVQMLVSITLGALLFKEGQYLQRMSAGLLMICGVLLVSWSAR